MQLVSNSFSFTAIVSCKFVTTKNYVFLYIHNVFNIFGFCKFSEASISTPCQELGDVESLEASAVALRYAANGVLSIKPGMTWRNDIVRQRIPDFSSSNRLNR